MRKYRGRRLEVGIALTIDDVLFTLSGGDLSKAMLLEQRPVSECYEWYYLERVKRVNEGWSNFH